MKRFRSVVFWMHLAAGVTAGVIILVMSTTGALLALKPQILNAVEAKVRIVAPPPGAARLGVQTIVASVRTARPDSRPTTVTLQSDPAASVSVALGRDGTIYVDPYSGRVLGEGSMRAQLFFRTVEDWHRWLGTSGEQRTAARAVTGASNIAFFFLALTGPYLWWPRTWSWSSVRGIIWFRVRTQRPRARFQLAQHDRTVVRADPRRAHHDRCGDVVSVGQRAAVPRGREPAAGQRWRSGCRSWRDERSVRLPDNLDAIWARAAEQVPTWRSITARLPTRSGAPVTFTIVDARSWNAFARSQLTVDAATAKVSKWEPYDATSRGQKWRGWVRFGHTGELAGLPGQIVAGLACAGGAMLVWTGLSLAIRRFLNWRRVSTRSNAAAA